MIYKYRITQYNPKYRNINGVYTQNEWISVYDLGRFYNERQFCLKEYIQTENSYILAIKEFLCILNITKMYIEKLEKNVDIDFVKKQNTVLKDCDLDMEKLMESVVKMQELNLKNICIFSKMALREYIWGILSYDNIKIEFGYDYYMYFYSNVDCYEQLVNAQIQGIFIERLE